MVALSLPGGNQRSTFLGVPSSTREEKGEKKDHPFDMGQPDAGGKKGVDAATGKTTTKRNGAEGNSAKTPRRDILGHLGEPPPKHSKGGTGVVRRSGGGLVTPKKTKRNVRLTGRGYKKLLVRQEKTRLTQFGMRR